MKSLLALLCFVTGLEQPDPFRAVAERMREDVVQLRARALLGVRGQDGRITKGEAELTGSGVLIGKGLAVANLHLAVLPDAEGRLAPVESVEIVVPGQGAFSATLLGGDVDLDIAVFRLEGGDSLPGAALAESDPAVDESVVAMGATGDRIAAVRSAISEVRDAGFVLAAPLGRDFWGGPVFDSQGKLVGVLGPIAAVRASALRVILERSGAM
ncbi:MAG TPA: serine protease [Myxococcales bacterium]